MEGPVSAGIVPLGMGIAFMLVMLWLIRRAYGEQQFQEFATANQTFGTWAITFSMMATWFVGASYTAWMGMAVNYGFIYLYGPIYGAYCVILFYLIADKLWLWGKAHQLSTQGDVWALRYDARWLKALVGIVGLSASFPWLIMEFWTLGYLISYASYQHLPFVWAMAIGALVVAFYVTMGGMRAVVSAHFVQGLFFILGAIVFTYFMVSKNVGGIGATMRSALELFPEVLTYPGPGWNPPNPYWTSIIVTSSVGGFLWPWCMNRAFAADSVRTIRRASWQSVYVSTLVCLFGFFFFGISAHHLEYARAHPQEAWLWFADKMGGPLYVGIAFIVALSTALGTVSSLIHFFGVSIASDVMRTLNPKLHEKSATRYAQIIVILISVVAFIFANMKLPALVFIALLTYQFIIQLGPGQLIGLWWKRGNVYGAVAGLLAGVGVALYLTFIDVTGTGFGGWTAGMWGLLVNLIVYVALGYALPPSKRTEELFQEVQALKEEAAKPVAPAD
ncbi:MAG TPA: sodium:solute symporter family protein [Clostridia bacterium]|nr:sodium:solute symporter family protein [Clostridia bacterium]